MKVTAVEELVIRTKRSHKLYWRDASDWYWFRKLVGEVIELAASLIGLHKDSPLHELEQIASIAMNWIERGTHV